MLLLALALATQATSNPGQMIRTRAHDFGGNVVFNRDMRRQTQVMMLKRDIERTLSKQVVFLTKLGSSRRLRDDEVLRDLVTATEPNLLDLHIWFSTPDTYRAQNEPLGAAPTMMAKGASISDTIKDTTKGTISDYRYREWEASRPKRIKDTLNADASSGSNESDDSSDESENTSPSLPELRTRFDQPRKWGETRPGEFYPQYEGPGNPSWERRNPLLNPERSTPEQSTADESEEASPRSSPMDDRCSRPSSMYPAHWGCPPGLQTADYRLLPGGYGYGSSTLAAWISRNMARDAEQRRNLDEARATPDAERRGGAFVVKPFPARWGNPPALQTMDFVVLPGGYGHGSSTLASWIRMNMQRDAGSRLPRFPIMY